MKAPIGFPLRRTALGLLGLAFVLSPAARAAGALDPDVIAKAIGLQAATVNGVVRVGWPRTVPVTVDGELLPLAWAFGPRSKLRPMARPSP